MVDVSDMNRVANIRSSGGIECLRKHHCGPLHKTLTRNTLRSHSSDHLAEKCGGTRLTGCFSDNRLTNKVSHFAELRGGDTLTDLFCGVGLLGVSLAKRMMDDRQHLKFLYGYEVYNQAVANARTNATHAGLRKGNFQIKSADLSQPTLGVPINTDVVICGEFSRCYC